MQSCIHLCIHIYYNVCMYVCMHVCIAGKVQICEVDIIIACMDI